MGRLKQCYQILLLFAYWGKRSIRGNHGCVTYARKAPMTRGYRQGRRDVQLMRRFPEERHAVRLCASHAERWSHTLGVTLQRDRQTILDVYGAFLIQ